MDQLSQRSSSERTQFMSREDLDQEGSLDLDHDHYHYQDQDQDNYTDQELEQYEDQKAMRGDHFSTPTKTLELKVHDDHDCSACCLAVVPVVTNASLLRGEHFLQQLQQLNQSIPLEQYRGTLASFCSCEQEQGACHGFRQILHEPPLTPFISLSHVPFHLKL